MTFEQFEKKVQSIQTLFTQRHAYIVYGLIRSMRCMSVIEIGSFMGYMTAWMARAMKDNGDGGLVYAIDNFSLGTSPEILHNNLFHLELANGVGIIKGDSMAMHPGELPPCDLAFIDGNHGFEGVTNDVRLCVELGAQCLILHDYESWWGVNRFVKEFEQSIQSHEWGMIRFPYDEGLAVMMKRTPIGEPKYTEEQYPKGIVE